MTNHHYQQVLEQLEQQTTVITPNNRLAKTLLEDYLSNQRQRCIAKPACWAYETFIQQLYHAHIQQKSHIAHPILLSKPQTQILWTQQLQLHNTDIPQGAVSQIIQAWSYCQRWEINMDDNEWEGTEQTRQFRGWSKLFTNQLKQLNLITLEQIVPYLIAHQDCQTITTYKEMIWFCFDEITPQQQALQSYLSNQGVVHQHLDLSDRPAEIKYIETTDEESELSNIINWIKSQREQSHQPIGIVVPDLNTKADRFNRLLLQHFPSDSFNISLGKTLADYALVSHALEFISLNQNAILQEQATLLLHSPFLTHAQQEMLPRMQYLQDNPLLQEHRIDRMSFIRSIEMNAPELASALKKISPYPQQASPLVWANLFQTRLSILGFPGGYSLDSHNYQCYQRLLLLFDEFKQLNLISPSLTRKQALHSLKQLTLSTIFQPEKGNSSPIHILGLLEAAGCQFAAIWISNMTNQCLPQKTQFSAFIPLSIQKRYHLPYTNPEREYFLAEQLLTRFRYAAKTVILSYPLFTDDQHNLPTPLLHALPIEKAEQPTQIVAAQSSSQHEAYPEDYQHPCAHSELTTGNTALLGNQAKCPFRAFSAHRLHLKRAQTKSEGLHARERGIIIHHVMELFWTEVQSQNHLNKLSEASLQALIEKNIELAIKPYQKLRRYSFSQIIQQLEKERLFQLIEAIIHWEKNRPSFKINALEKTQDLNLGPIRFTVRVDRIDTVNDQEAWVIDYKTRLPNKMPWNDDALTEPQLLLYALLDKAIRCILFLELRNNQVTSKGLSETELDLQGIKPIREHESWDTLKKIWQQQLESLAQAFYDGKCSPEPFNSSLCAQCEFSDLCRVPLIEDTRAI